MSDASSPSSDLLERVHNFVLSGADQELKDDDWVEFEHLLREDDNAFDLYFEYVRETTMLQTICDTLTSEDASRLAEQPTTPSPLLDVFGNAGTGVFGYFSASWSMAYLIATILTTAGLLTLAYTNVSPHLHIAKLSPSSTTATAHDVATRAVARITGMVDCKWAEPQTATTMRAQVSLGRTFALSSGLMEITYNTGATVILQGPVTYEVESCNGGFMSVGKLTGKVEAEKAKGFCVRTPTATVTDLGTEFGIEVDRRGETISYVFRGAVHVRPATAANQTERPGRVLHATESIRVTNHSAAPMTATPNAAPAQFIRRLPKPSIKTFDLVDVVAGGNGYSGRRNRGIDPTNGRVVHALLPNPDAIPVSDGRYHRVEGLRFVDGVFIPSGRHCPMRVDSVGHTFDGWAETNGGTAEVLWAGGSLGAGKKFPVPTVLGGVDYASDGHAFLFLHANKGITFDLEAIRLANLGYRLLRLRAVAGNVEPASQMGEPVTADFSVLIDGRVRYKRRQFNRWNGATTVNVPIDPQDRFLTLTATDGGNDIGYDWILFGDPCLELVPTDAATAVNPSPR
jgi:hypothetical protein